jgi:hypothetical protein
VPVFDGRDISSGCHITAVGSFTRDTRELDDAFVPGANILVDSRVSCLAEAGDILMPQRTGAIDNSAILAEIGEGGSSQPWSKPRSRIVRERFSSRWVALRRMPPWRSAFVKHGFDLGLDIEVDL